MSLQKRISTLLMEWAGETSEGTTALLTQLSAAGGVLPDVRSALVSFTDKQARDLAVLVQQLPDPNLQSLTGSAFAYLQRIDTALGNPVDLARLLPTLGLNLPTTAPTSPQTSDAAEKRATPTMKIRRRPSRSAARIWLPRVAAGAAVSNGTSISLRMR